MKTDLKPLALRPNQACEVINVGRDKLFSLLADGSIRSFREGNSRLIPVASIEEYLAKRLDREDA